MLSSTLIFAVLSLLGSATASKHHNCGCTINGVYSVSLSQLTCLVWEQEGEPNTHFDGYSCVDNGSGRGIDGYPWNIHCQNQYSTIYGGVPTDAQGKCWHDS